VPPAAARRGVYAVVKSLHAAVRLRFRARRIHD
jgi:hypothetical protein